MIENISTVIISKNASKTIKTTLDSLKKFKEVILFDNGSTDDTLYIAGTYNNVIISKGKFIGFGATKNHAITFAKNNWIFSIDADEITKVNGKKIEGKLSDILKECKDEVIFTIKNKFSEKAIPLATGNNYQLLEFIISEKVTDEQIVLRKVWSNN